MSSPQNVQVTEVIFWCQGYLAELLGVGDPSSLDPKADFDRLGVDSAQAVSLLMELDSRYGVDLSAEELFETPTLAALADAVVAQLASAAQ